MNRDVFRQLRALAVSGRVSDLPTVWSNCLAGWWLGGGGNFAKLPLLFFGLGALYTGGMLLNDVSDADFDRQRHANHPTTPGTISLPAVWRWGLVWLGLGTLGLVAVGKTTGALTLALLLSFTLYDAPHKVITASPGLMGACRFWIYLIAGSAGARGVSGWLIWCGAALASYVAGLGGVAGRESVRGPVPPWPLALLAAPIVLAMLMNSGEFRVPAIWLSLVLALWLAASGRTIFQRTEPNFGRMVSGLLAGIVFVDWLAVAPECPRWLSFIFLTLFAATLLLQRLVPAG
jgi:4-hydroxybenzoate polyprenyltransferase